MIEFKMSWICYDGILLKWSPTSADHIEIAEEPGPLDIATNDDGRRLEPWYKDDEELVRLVSG